MVPGHRMATFWLIIFSSALFRKESVSAVKVLLGVNGLKSVPDDINIDVTELYLTRNSITTLDNSSLVHFEKLRKLVLAYNPLRFIRDGTFDKNSMLKYFSCTGCKIESLPFSFGPAANSITEIDFTGGIADPAVLRSPFLDGFTSLRIFSASSIPLETIETIFIPPTIKTLWFGNNGIQIFPNVSAKRFPVLWSIGLDRNQFTHVSDSTLLGISMSLTVLNLQMGELESIGDITVLPNLKYVYLRKNNLETIPDLLNGLPKLLYLWITENKRLSCDRRMCWRRLWERVRTPGNFDDVMCQQPEEVKGLQLSEVNPKFMNCSEGSGDIHGYFWVDGGQGGNTGISVPLILRNTMLNMRKHMLINKKCLKWTGVPVARQ